MVTDNCLNERVELLKHRLYGSSCVLMDFWNSIMTNNTLRKYRINFFGSRTGSCANYIVILGAC
jgi:hypothetical protein